MTLEAYNTSRSDLARLDHLGWLNTLVNWLANIGTHFADFMPDCPNEQALLTGMGYKIVANIRQYRRRHRFYECLPGWPEYTSGSASKAYGRVDPSSTEDN